jgi:hypothetical protein
VNQAPVTAALMALTILVASRRGCTAVALAIGAIIAKVVARVLIMLGSSYLTDRSRQVPASTSSCRWWMPLSVPLTTIAIWICVTSRCRMTVTSELAAGPRLAAQLPTCC